MIQEFPVTVDAPLGDVTPASQSGCQGSSLQLGHVLMMQSVVDYNLNIICTYYFISVHAAERDFIFWSNRVMDQRFGSTTKVTI